MRSKLVAGNWKMHGSRAAISELLSELIKALPSEPRLDMAVFPPAVYAAQAVDALRGSALAVGLQNVCDQAGEGAFTGEVSVDMAVDIGCRYVMIGHSERRALYGESNELVVEKLARALEAGLLPIVCVGESESEREEGRTLDVVSAQLAPLFERFSLAELASLVVAYEPVWAIGTGKTASPAQAQEVHAFIRDVFAERDAEFAQRVRILYGGSVKAANAAELFSQADIDGGLVGGASLNAQEFSAICRAAE